MPRYVILEHTGTDSYKPGRHWDLMLEMDGRLKTWELESIPTSEGASPCRVLPDHRLLYLDYEGPLSEDRGSVRRWDAGEYEMSSECGGVVVVRLMGQRLSGTLQIARSAADLSIGEASFGDS
jgi:hypothetical protein